MCDERISRGTATSGAYVREAIAPVEFFMVFPLLVVFSGNAFSR